MATKKCEKCGAEHLIKRTRLTFRDKDTEECGKYGEVLLRWNGAVCYSAVLIQDPTE